MNLIYKLLFFLLPVLSIAQSDQMLSLGVYNSNSVMLRQFVDHQEKYDLIKMYGIKVFRESISQDSIILVDSLWSNSKVLIAHQFPVSESEMAMDTASIDLYKMAYYTQYSDQYKPTPLDPNNPKFSDIFEGDQFTDLRFAFLAMGVDQNFQLALDMGLATLDNSTSLNKWYRYTSVVINDSTGDTLIGPSFSFLSTYTDTEIEAVSQFDIEGDAGENRLLFKANKRKPSSAYNIYRSTDGIQFTKMNDLPFVPVFMQDQKNEEIVYLDSVDLSASQYHYLIKGITPFGFESSPSEIITVSSLNEKIDDLQLNMKESIIDEVNGTIQIRWSANTDHNSNISYYLLRGNTFYGVYDTLTPAPISGDNRSYMDTSPMDQNYYKVVAVDASENEYESNTQFSQMADIDPPASPLNLSVSYTSDNSLELQWDENTETDLRGYRVFVSNQMNGVYAQVTEQAIKANIYNYSFDNTVIGDSLYFKVVATDNTKNYSAKSSSLGIERKDNVPPSKPVLLKVVPNQSGIGFNFEFSPDESVKKHLLQRKLSIEPNWETFLVVNSAEQQSYCIDGETYCYLDSTALQYQAYDFRLIAQDPDYSESASEVITATPILVETSGYISDLVINHDTEVDTSSNGLNRRLGSLNKILEKSSYRASNDFINHIELTWSSALDENLKDFQVYRKLTGAQFELYQTIELDDGLSVDNLANVYGHIGQKNFSFRDENLIKGKRYTYKIVSRRKDGSESKNSMIKTIKL